MSSSTDNRSLSDDSEFNFISGYMPTNYRVETLIHLSLMVSNQPYADEPLADEDWTKQYGMCQAEKQRRLESLHNRLAGRKTIDKFVEVKLVIILWFT